MSIELERDIQKLWKQLTAKYPKYLWGWKESGNTISLSIMEKSTRAVSARVTLQNDLKWPEYGQHWSELYKKVQVA